MRQWIKFDDIEAIIALVLRLKILRRNKAFIFILIVMMFIKIMLIDDFSFFFHGD